MRKVWLRIPLWGRVLGVALALWPIALLVAPFVLVGWWSRQTGQSAWNSLPVLVPIVGFVYIAMALWYLGKHGIRGQPVPQLPAEQ